MTRILLTGAGGFIGRRVAPLLVADGLEVVGIGRRERPHDFPTNAKWQRIDLFDAAGTARAVAKLAATHCLNLAWYVEHGKYWRAPENIDSVQASINLLSAFRDAGGTRFVGVGTCAEYDWSHGYLAETVTPRAARTPYGRIKNALGETTLAYADAAGLSAAWARLFFLYGANEDPNRLVPYTIRRLLDGNAVRTTAGDQIRDFCHVDDVARGLAKLVTHDLQGAINIASGRPVTVRTIVDTIAEQIGRADLVERGAIPTASDEPPLLVADVTRMTKELGHMPGIDLKDGIANTIASHRDHPNLAPAIRRVPRQPTLAAVAGR